MSNEPSRYLIKKHGLQKAKEIVERRYEDVPHDLWIATNASGSNVPIARLQSRKSTPKQRRGGVFVFTMVHPPALGPVSVRLASLDTLNNLK